MPQKAKRLGGKRKKTGRSFAGGRKLRKQRKQQRTTKVAKKLSSAVQYGPRIAPRSIIAKLRWYNLYGGPLTEASSPWVEPYDNEGLHIPGNSTYLRTWNLSSIFKPDMLNDDTGAGNSSVYNYTEYQPHYQKWIVRAAKIKGFVQAIMTNSASTAAAVPCSVWMWADNNPQAQVVSVNTNKEAFIQAGRRCFILRTNTYNPVTKKFKIYYRHQKILKRRLDEDEDFGTMTTSTTGASAGTDPNNNATVYFHMLVVNNTGGLATEEQAHMAFSWSLDITFYTKLWDSPIDAPDTIDPDEV